MLQLFPVLQLTFFTIREQIHVRWWHLIANDLISAEQLKSEKGLKNWSEYCASI